MKPSAIAQSLPALMKVGLVPMLWGAPGVGKSDVVAQVAKALGCELRDVRLTLFDPVDLKGFPDKDADTQQMRFLPPSFLPPMKVKGKPNKTKGILFLDELVSAERSVQAAAYQLILNRSIGEYTLPEGWHVIAAGNRASDRALVNAMPSALANRFVHIDYDVSHDDFCDWAIQHGDIDPLLLAFLRFRANLLHDFKPAENPRAFPSPRSWMFVNRLLRAGMPAADEHALIAGTVGDGAASELVAFIRIYRDLPDIDAILTDPMGSPVPDSKPSVMYALATALGAKVTAATMDAAVTYVNRWSPEFQVLFMRDAARRDKSLTTTKAFVTWAVKNSELLGGTRR